MWGPAAASIALLLGASNPDIPPLLRWVLIVGCCWAGAEAVVRFVNQREARKH